LARPITRYKGRSGGGGRTKRDGEGRRRRGFRTGIEELGRGII